MPFCCFGAFWGKFIENISFYSKSDYPRNEHWNTQKVCFSYHVWKGQILRNIWICLNNCFLIKPVKGDKYYHKVFFPQNEPHTTKLCLSVVCSIMGEIHRELFFYTKKWLSKKRALKYTESLLFLPCLKGANSEENLDLFKQ